MSTVVMTEDVTGPAYDELGERRTIVRDPDAWKSAERLRNLLGDADAVIVRNRTQVDQDFLEAAPKLKVVARAGVGLDNIDLDAANRAGVVVISPTGANAISVGEHAVALALALAKRLAPVNASTTAGQWERTPTQELSGKTWGLLSAGATARATARVARGLGMRVVACDPYVDPQSTQIAELGIELAAFETVLAAANVLSIHLPYTEATSRLLNAQTLALLPMGAIVINVGRGEVVDEDALLDALESGRVGGAGLDVRAAEPPVTGRLERHPNVILTPHVAGITVQSQDRIGQILCHQIDAVLDGGHATYAAGSHSEPSKRVPL
jgi:D-3-phosphoglycerate dehydrogenase/(S)-sulfolactate dehydrogenase